MNPEYYAAAMAMPSFGDTVFSTNKFSEACAYAEKITRPYKVTSRALRSEISLVHGQLMFEHITFDQMKVECRGRFDVAAPQLDDRYLLQLNIAGECLVEQGPDTFLASAGSMFVINPQSMSRKTWNNGCQQLMVWVRRSALQRALERELGYDLDRPLVFGWPTLDQGFRIAALWRRISAVLAQLRDTASPPHWRSVRQIENLIMLDLITSMPNNYSEDLDRPDNAVAPYYVRRVERFLHSNLREAIEMDDIYQIAQVSPRALFYGFRQFRRTTPMALLKKLRLDQARKELLQASRDGGSVTGTAMNCGFQNLSMFSREYKARFGEAPSETLRCGVN